MHTLFIDMENQRQGGFKKSFPKRSFGGNSGGSRPGIKGRFSNSSRGGRSSRSNPGERLDFSRFINKAIITEEIEQFIPEHAFSDFLVDERLKKAIGHKGYVLPTPIQDRAIPHILKGVDVVGIANTGTGKTATFLIPLINKVLLNKYEKIMVVVPTRELAIQINDELRGFTPTLRVFSTCCVGGMGIGKQIADLKYNPSFVIGTPGRLKDLIERKKIMMNEFNTIVLDEADRMLDMGFINDMKYIMKMMPENRHTLFFSATLSKDIEALINDFLRNPVRISVKTQDTSKNVDQDVVRVSHGQDKIEVLHDLLNDKEFSKVLIFGRTKHGVEELSKRLLQKGFKAESIHGNKNHSQRQKALKLFKDNNVQILVATDVAARGLDISDITHVINYELPETYDDYVHRIGRTGRGSKKGKALTFIGGSAPKKRW
ncbi:MAG: ATP-dependent helicase DeaD [Patescibacteria group bacterium]|nr:ATP-dependent helicase DeaD [Patescibacteria group bacterium]